MERLLLVVAGCLQLLLIPVNLVAPGKLRYAESLAGARPIVRNIFWVHAWYIVFVVAGFAALSIAFAEELASGTPMARAICAYLAVFWGARVFVQGLYYDKATRRENRAFDVAFLALFASLAAIYGWVAAGGTA